MLSIRGKMSEVIEVFKKSIAQDIAIPVAAMNSLTYVISRSTAMTYMGLEKDLRAAIDELKRCKVEVFMMTLSLRPAISDSLGSWWTN